MRSPSRYLPLVVALATGALALAPRGVAAQATPPAIAMVRVAVATHALARGAVLTDSDVAYVERQVSGPDAALDHIELGWMTRRVVNAGETLRRPAVEPPLVVMANQTVDATWADGPVQITLRGTVTKDGAVGDHVTVRTTGGRHLNGVVTGPGTVRIE